ncbi:uncharacterized protein LOC120424347 [Culex pipiens pallens]|uniref:uncharacterized protein LOC120424347 n=1 Tax=Culex pipiens pallens TaxID=42434 RepID=UPI001953761B|nr:uncharacterized protein LOC120424347 [Culex pipiens pallens]
MFLSSKLPARFVAAKTRIATRLHPRAQDPYGHRKGSVSRTRKEANFGDRGAFPQIHPVGRMRLSCRCRTRKRLMKLRKTTAGRWRIGEKQDSNAFHPGAKQCVIRMVKAQFDSMEPTAVPNQQEDSPGASISAESGGGEQPEPDQEDDPESRDNRKKRQFNNNNKKQISIFDKQS